MKYTHPSALLIVALLSLAMPPLVTAQTASVSVNAVDCADFGTLNAEASVAVARHLSVNAAARYNPWSFGSDGSRCQNRTRTLSAGARWWPWNIYSGWWLGARAQWEEYNRGGITSLRTEEGDAWGAAASAGYSLMLHRSLNLDLGVGLWGGYRTYTVYACPTCGRITGSGSGVFIMPSDLIVSIMFTF